jgi:PKD repeat protein
MMRWKSGIAVVVVVGSLVAGRGSPSSQAAAATGHPPTGVGSCTLKGWDPNLDPSDAKDLPPGMRPQTYKPDNYDCTGATFAPPGVEFARFPQPNKAAPTSNPLAPYFPPFTHFVTLYRENHTFDDYLGDCATTIKAGCNGVVQGTNHIGSVPNLHTLAKTYALMDAYSTGTQPPSGPNHWWLFSAQSSSHSQQQSYPVAGGTQFDRFLKGPSGGYPFIMNGDFYWMLSNGSGYWRNPATNNIEVLPVNRPGTTIPEELNYNHYTCCGQNDPDPTIANDYMNFVTANGLPTYSYVELFNDHPGTFQDIPTNDSVTKQVVDFIMNNTAYKDNTVIVITEDDTQNGNNGPDHVSNTYRVPAVIVASPTFMKQHYLSHVAYTTNNVVAAMERVLENVHPGVIDPNNHIGLATFPMTTADQAGLGDPLEDLWIQGTTPLSATASGTPTTGNAPLNVSFAGSATGGTAPYSYSWNFGDGSAASTLQNPSHTYNSACTCTATLTVTDSSAPVKTATSNVTITVRAVGGPLVATATGTPSSGQVPLNVAFTGTATGGTPPYGYGWNFGDGSAASTLQNPSHTYNAPATYTATLTVTDSSAPVKTATSNVTITVSPIAGTPPGPPTGLTATAGNAQISLGWVAPANNGGVSITSYNVYRGTSSGNETPLTAGGCSGLGAVLSCTDTGLTNGQAYFYKVSAVNAIGEGKLSNEASATPVANTNPLSQNFDGSNAIPPGWTATGLWRVGSDCLGAASPPNSLQFNSASTCDYNPLRSRGFATSPTFDISAASAPTVTFNTKYQVESYSGHTDQMKVQAKSATGAWTTLWTRDSTNPAQTTFTPVTLDLSAFKSAGSQVRFSFDSKDAFPRSHPGWAVDDVAVQSGAGGSVTVTNPGSQSGTVGTATSLQISATDTAGGMLTYSATGLPAGLTIDSSTGLMSGTPTTAGPYSVTVTATDSTGPSGSASFTWTIGSGTTNTVTVTNPGSQTGTVGTAVSLQIQASDSASGQTLTYSAAGLPAGLSIDTSTGLISGTPTTSGNSSVTVTATDTTNASGSATFAWTVSPASACTPSQLLGNPGFETGSAAPWSATSGVINNSSSEPAHTGSWDAWLDGYGTTHTDTLSQSITLPTGCSAYQFNFWLHIDTAETSTTTAYDTLKVQVLDSSGTVVATLATYSNLDHNTGYSQKSFSLAPYAGQAVTLKFTGAEDSTKQTSFVIDDTAVNVS